VAAYEEQRDNASLFEIIRERYLTLIGMKPLRVNEALTMNFSTTSECFFSMGPKRTGEEVLAQAGREISWITLKS